MVLAAPPLHPGPLLPIAEHVAALPAWVLLAYLASGVRFILALRGLSSPATSQRGNRQGMIGMAIAVATTLATQAPIPPGALLPQPTPAELRILLQILAAIAVGGTIGIVTARRIAMTDMPQLVAEIGRASCRERVYSSV